MKTKPCNPITQFSRDKEVNDQLPILRTIKYSGNKARLLPAISWIVRQVVAPGGKILDLMAGTHCVGYALKQAYQIYANDIQRYSYVIGKAYIENGGYSITRSLAEKDLLPGIAENSRKVRYNLFQKEYVDTYFTASQCVEIDNIRAAIDAISSPKRELYLTALMSGMCYASNSTGHFAEFLNETPSKPKSVQDLFFRKCENVSIAPSRYENHVFNVEHGDFLYGANFELSNIVKECDLVYIDPPYSGAQYSRFYHILETVVKYDYPLLEFKGLYRGDRYFSPFCRKSFALDELNKTLKKCSEICKGFVLLSYVDSKTCLIPRDKVEDAMRSHFKHTTMALTFEVPHSKLGNGVSKNVAEYLILATNLTRGEDIASKINSRYESSS